MIQPDKHIQATRDFVQAHLSNAEAGHDFAHVERVYTTAMEMANEMQADRTIVALASLLHDVGDAKFHEGDETVGPRLISKFLQSQDLAPEVKDAVEFITGNMSFRKSSSFDGAKSIEFMIVQDADRLDSMGAIGVARAFSFGGYKGRPFYNPSEPLILGAKSTAYQSGKAPTIQHFYEKLLLLKDLMNTPAGKQRAEKRHAFMVQFLNQFFDEWNGKA